MSDTKDNIVDIRIGNENLNERASSRGMIRMNKKYISKVIMIARIPLIYVINYV